jgi:hypothetical protein
MRLTDSNKIYFRKENYHEKVFIHPYGDDFGSFA